MRIVSIGSIFGIRINVNASWLFIFAFVAWSFANAPGVLQIRDLSITERVLLGSIGSLLFFASVLAHELAHSLVARSRGIPVRGITLFLFGGVSAIDGEPATAPAEAWIAGVGPLTSLVIGASAIGIAFAIGPAAIVGKIALYLGVANVGLAIFNSLPAYPLDGGRVMHAIVWRISRDKAVATRVTVGLGRILAWALIALGIAQTFASGFGGGLWTTFMGWYLLQAGNVERTRLSMNGKLDGHVARELAAASDMHIAANATAFEAQRFLSDRKARASIVTIGEVYAGVISLDDIAQTPVGERERVFVTSVMQRPESVATADPNAPASAVVREMAQNERTAVALVDDAGEFAGLLTRESVMHWLVNSGDATARAPR